MMSVLPVPIQAQSMSSDLKSGPYVDKLLYKTIINGEDQVQALIDGELDVLGDLDISAANTLAEASNIEISSTLRNGYGYISINCDKYPFNFTAFRRALAFALDKEAISEVDLEGYAQPLDSCVPSINPFSVEGQLEYSYYEVNIELANQLLDQAGFVIDNETGFRLAPNGEAFDVLVECAQSSSNSIVIGERVAQALVALNIDGISVPTDFYEYLNRIYFHGSYDIVFLGDSFNNFDVDWLAYHFTSDYSNSPYWNFANFRNATFDSWRNQLLHATEYEEVYEAAIEMQKIFVYQSPQIICYENLLPSAYRTDKFDGFVNDVNDGVSGWWTNYKVRLKPEHGGPFGGTLQIGTWTIPDCFNFMITHSSITSGPIAIEGMYESLLRIGPDGNDIPWLAESYTAETHSDNRRVPDGYTRFNFDIIQNATWSDGTPLTADDVAYSLNYYRDAPGNPLGVSLSDMTAAYALTTYSMRIEFSSESYWHLHSISYKPIMPKHVFIEIGVDYWNLWNPQPPEEPIVTSGAFNISHYVLGESIELSKNPNYFFDAVAPPELPINFTDTNTGTPLEIIMEAIGNASPLSLMLTIPSLVVIAIVIIKWKLETS